MKDMLKPLAMIAILTVLLAACGVEPETPAVSMQKSKGYITDGDYMSAKLVLQSAVQSNPSDTTLRYELAKLQFLTGDFLGAEKEVLRAQDLGMAGNQTQALLSRVLFRQYRYEDVIALEEDIAKGLTPDDSAVVFSMIARSFLAQLDINPAQLRLDVALEQNPQSVSALVGMATLEIIQNKGEEALSWAKKARDVDPANVDGWYAVAAAHRSLNQPEKAIEALGKAIELRLYIDLMHAERALLLLAQKQFPAAQKDIDTLVLSPYKKFWFTLYVKGRLQFAQGEYQAAVTSFHDVLAQNPRHGETEFYAAIAHSMLGNEEQARVFAAQAAVTLSGRGEPEGLLASVMINSGDEKDREQGYRILGDLVAANPGNTTPLQVLATAYMGDGKYKKAIPLFEKLLAIDPERADMQQLLMMARMQSGAGMELLQKDIDQLSSQYEKDFWTAFSNFNRGAIAEARVQALEMRSTYPDKIDPVKLLAIGYMAEKDWVNARRVFGEIIELTNGSLEALEHMVVLERAAGDRAAAKATLEDLLQHYAKDPDAVLFVFSQYNHLGDRDRAAKVLESAFAENPDELSLRRVLIVHRFAGEDYRGVIDLAQGIDANTLNKSAQLLELYGMALERVGQNELAVLQFQQLAKLQPTSARAQLIYAEMLEKLGRLSDAKKAYERSAEIAPDNYYLTTRHIKFLISIQETDRARARLVKAQSAYGEREQLLVLEGHLELLEGNAKGAAEKWQTAYNLTPSAGTAIWLSRAYVFQLKFDEALDALDAWLAEHPDELFALMEKAGVSLSQKKEQDALVVYKNVIRTYPDHIPALNNVAWLSQNVDMEYALVIANRAFSLQPQEPAVLDTLGYLQLKAGESKSALTHLQHAAELAPKDQQIKLHLASALAANNQKDEARQLLKDVINGSSSEAVKKEAELNLESL